MSQLPSIHCIIIDDEAASRVVLRELIARFCPSVSVVGEGMNVEQGVSLINQLSPDLVFLDIQMPGKDGFELLRQFDNPTFSVIFMTSFNEYAIKAIRFNALDYLLKPIDIDELCAAIDRLLNQKSLNLNQEVSANTLNFNPLNPKMAFHLADKVEMVFLNDIVFFEAMGNYSKAVSIQGKAYTQARTLTDLELMIAEYPQFVRIHKSVTINLQYVKSYSKGDPCIITLAQGSQFEISRRRKADLLRVLEPFTIKKDG